MSVRPSWRRTAVALAAGVALAATPLAANAAESTALAPLQGADSATAITGRYIVVLKDGTDARTVSSVIASVRATASATYGTVFHGFAAALDATALAAVRANPAVAYVQADQIVTLQDTQTPATWGIDRVDQRDTPLSNSYTWTNNGAGVRVYDIDTGLRTTHTEFTGRVSGGINFVGNEPAGNFQDCNGHGTHTAGTVAGTTWGVAKGVTITPVRVIGCGSSGPTSDIVQGIDWVAANHVSPSMATMSIGGGIDNVLDDAAEGLVDSGVAFTVSAGNANTNACNASPARVAKVITVAASTISDREASFSNHGSCIDVYAPGENITSAWIGSDTDSEVLDGTSMAAPHVAGAVVRLLANRADATPAQLSTKIISLSTKNTLTNLGPGSANRMLYIPPQA